MQDYVLPEWSHMTLESGERFTAALYHVIARDFWGPAATPATAAQH
jgi:hypothetical protein